MKRYLQWPGIISTIIVVGIVLCLLALGAETNWGRQLRYQPVIDAQRPAQAASAALVPSAALASLDTGFTESADRPLFMPTRRPVPTAAASTAMKRGQFLLVGTSRSKEFGDSAMLKEIATNKTSVVKAGATIKDMTVESINADKVVLKVGEETEELVMKARPGTPAPAAPSGPIPAGPGRLPPAMAGQPGMTAQPAPAGMLQPAPMTAPGAGIFGGPANVTVPPGSQIVPGAPGTPTVFPGAPGTNIAPAPAKPGVAPGRPATPEEILERRRRARAQQTP
jgi:hypothetical protein